MRVRQPSHGPLRGVAAVIFEVVVVSLGCCGVCKTELAARFGFDFGGRKNELSGDGFGIDGHVVSTVSRPHFHEIALGYGGVEFSLPLGFALGLQGSEFAQGLIERAVQALFVEGQVGEGFRIVAEDARGGEGRVDLGMFGFDSPAASEWPSASMASSNERARFRRHWVSQKVWAYCSSSGVSGARLWKRRLQKVWYWSMSS